MQLFGIVSLLVVVALVGWWFSAGITPGSSDGTGSLGRQGVDYEGVLESARQVTGGNSVTSNTKNILVYDGISVPSDSYELDVSGRRLTGSLKAEIRFLTRLQVLDISNNEFTGLPAELGQLNQLQILNLSNNPLTGLPHELGDLYNLEVIDLRGTSYNQTDLEVIRAKLPSGVQILVD